MHISGEMIALLAQFTEMPDDIKLFQLSKLMHKSQQKTKDTEEFKKILSSLSVELVSVLINWHFLPLQVNNEHVRSLGNLLQDAVDEGKKDFVRILLEFGCSHQH